MAQLGLSIPPLPGSGVYQKKITRIREAWKMPEPTSEHQAIIDGTTIFVPGFNANIGVKCISAGKNDLGWPYSVWDWGDGQVMTVIFDWIPEGQRVVTFGRAGLGEVKITTPGNPVLSIPAVTGCYPYVAGAQPGELVFMYKI